MLEKQRERAHNTERKISLRWKALQVLGTVLMAFGLFIDWPPPQDADLPDTASFLMIIGALLGVVGLLLALRRE